VFCTSWRDTLGTHNSRFHLGTFVSDSHMDWPLGMHRSQWRRSLVGRSPSCTSLFLPATSGWDRAGTPWRSGWMRCSSGRRAVNGNMIYASTNHIFMHREANFSECMPGICHLRPYTTGPHLVVRKCILSQTYCNTQTLWK